MLIKNTDGQLEPAQAQPAVVAGWGGQRRCHGERCHHSNPCWHHPSFITVTTEVWKLLMGTGTTTEIILLSHHHESERINKYVPTFYPSFPKAETNTTVRQKTQQKPEAEKAKRLPPVLQCPFLRTSSKRHPGGVRISLCHLCEHAAERLFLNF